MNHSLACVRPALARHPAGWRRDSTLERAHRSRVGAEHIVLVQTVTGAGPRALSTGEPCSCAPEHVFFHTFWVVLRIFLCTKLNVLSRSAVCCCSVVVFCSCLIICVAILRSALPTQCHAVTRPAIHRRGEDGCAAHLLSAAVRSTAPVLGLVSITVFSMLLGIVVFIVQCHCSHGGSQGLILGKSVCVC